MDVTIADGFLGDLHFRMLELSLKNHDSGTFKMVGSFSESRQYMEIILCGCVGRLNWRSSAGALVLLEDMARAQEPNGFVCVPVRLTVKLPQILFSQAEPWIVLVGEWKSCKQHSLGSGPCSRVVHCFSPMELGF